MDLALQIIIFFFGTIIGSFLNVVILRYRSGRTLNGRSGCFSCGKTLSFFELIPIGSFFTQKGRCTHCKSKISWQYPIVEALTGILFVFLYYRFQYLLPASALLFGVLFIYYAILISILIVLSFYDLKHHILPDGITVMFASVAFIGMFFIQGDAIILHLPTMWHFLAGILLPAPFSFIWYISKGKWMGLGDSKLMIGLGFLFSISAGVTAILLSFWIGALFSILLVIAGLFLKGKKISLTTAIPFGPFLALGTIIVILGNLDFTSILKMFY